MNAATAEIFRAARAAAHHEAPKTAAEHIDNMHALAAVAATKRIITAYAPSLLNQGEQS